MHSLGLIIGTMAAAVAVGLVVVVRTRWLQSHTLAKCVLLSVGLHLLLAVVCGLLAGAMPASRGHDEEGRMTMVTVADDETVDELSETDAPAVEPTEPPSVAAPAVASMSQEKPVDLVSAVGVPEDVVPLLSVAAEVAKGDEPSPTDLQLEPRMPGVYADRLPARRAVAAVTRGGSEATERAVRQALLWLAANQAEDGRWETARHGGGRGHGHTGPRRNQATGVGSDHGVTGLALLAFLGAGSTHASGPHADCVAKGLRFLIDRQRADGSLSGDAEFFAALYCHGMAGIALAEAAAMTGDASLRGPLERAVGHTLAAQHPTTGGWRYAAGDQGDTSQLGWQVMLLEAAAQAGLDAGPGSGIDRGRQLAGAFLQSVSSGRVGGLAAYRAGERPTMPMTAEALFCRLLLGTPPDHPSVSEALAMIAGSPPDASRPNAYAWYYASLASFHSGGPQWEAWNRRLQPALLSLQRQDAGGLQGSWDPDPVWGEYGGRVYATAMAAVTLEVYYRYVPGHGETIQVARNR